MIDKTRLAEAIRDACLNAALQAYEDAGISGLCAEGRWEYAVQAIRTIDLAKLIPPEPPPQKTNNCHLPD
jgi:hypothetical protein